MQRYIRKQVHVARVFIEAISTISVMSHLATLSRNSDAQPRRRSEAGQSYMLHSIRETSCATRRHATPHCEFDARVKVARLKSPGVTSHLVTW